MKDSDIMQFGKYKGEKLGDVPASYLLWFYAQSWAKEHKDLYEYVNANIEHLRKEKEEDFELGAQCRWESQQNIWR